MVEDDGRLMERVQDRDADAFEGVYDRYHRLVYGLALRVLADPAAAEDVTQAVFLKIWNEPSLFRGGNFAAWIARVARNRALDAARSRAVHAGSELPESLPADDALEETAMARLDGERVRKRWLSFRQNSASPSSSASSAARRTNRSLAKRACRSVRSKLACAPACAGCATRWKARWSHELARRHAR